MHQTPFRAIAVLVEGGGQDVPDLVEAHVQDRHVLRVPEHTLSDLRDQVVAHVHLGKIPGLNGANIFGQQYLYIFPSFWTALNIKKFNFGASTF